MIRLRHVLHPVRSARSAYRRAASALARQYAARAFRGVVRTERDRCWCGGGLRPFAWHPSYGVCATCGCYVNRRPPRPEELRRLYSFDLYWHARQRSKGYPSIEDRPAHDRADGRVDFWLGLIGRYAPAAGTAIEVGCAHGALLSDLAARGYTCIGVEPDEATAGWARTTTGLDIRPGFFPQVDLPPCDLFLAFDVIEHTQDPEAFLRGAAALLSPGGVGIIQTPIDRYDFQPPFGPMFGGVFDDLEHLVIFTAAGLHHLAVRCGLREIGSHQWRLAHEIVVLQGRA